jgi:sterol O-acyltransferase
MAESTSIDTAPQAGHMHQPTPRKPTRIDLLKPQLSDDMLKTGYGETASAISRYIGQSSSMQNTQLLTLTRPVDAPPP